MNNEEKKLADQLNAIRLEREKRCIDRINAILKEEQCELVVVPDVRINGQPVNPTVKAR